MIADRIADLGRGTQLAKIDIKCAFRNIPVHPADRYLLWKQAIYVDKVLPFGLRSAPKLFNAVADALQFCALFQGTAHVSHYLDDFIIQRQISVPRTWIYYDTHAGY